MNEFDKPYIFLRDSYFGTGGYNPYNDYSYLNRHPRETASFYNDRKKNSVLENIFQPLQDLFLEPIWSAKTELKTNNLTLQKIIEESRVKQQADKCILDFKLYGKSLFSIYTDVLDNGSVDSFILPDINTVFPDDIKQLKMDGLRVSSAEYIEHHMLDGKQIPVQVEYSGGLFSRKTLAWRYDQKKITIKDDLGEARRIKDFDGYKYGTLDKIGLKLDEIPKTFNLAQIQKQLFNLDTQRLDTLRKAGFPVLAVQTDGDITEFSLSLDTIIKIPGETKNLPAYIESQLEGVSLTNEIIDEKKSTVYKVFTNGLFSDNIKYTSALSTVIATKSFKNAVDTLYSVYQMIVTKLLDNLIGIYGLNTTYTAIFPDLDFDEDTIKDQAEGILDI